MLLSKDNSLVFVVDAQERLVPAMDEPDALIAQTVKLLHGAEILGVPRLASEQYPKGLGRTVAPVAALLDADSRIEKVCFSATGAPDVVERLKASGRTQIVLAGMETHVCVIQTAAHLRELGFSPYVVADAVASRRAFDKQIALQRMRHNGIEVVTTEMVLFEWLERAGSDLFRQVSALIR